MGSVRRSSEVGESIFSTSSEMADGGEVSSAWSSSFWAAMSLYWMRKNAPIKDMMAAKDIKSSEGKNGKGTHLR